MQRLQLAITFVKRLFDDFERKHLLLIAAGLSYYFIMSLMPAAVVLTAAAAYLPGKRGMQDLKMFFGYIAPPQAMSWLTQFLDSVHLHRAEVLSVGIIVALWASSQGVGGIIASLDLVHEVQTPRRLWTNKLLAIGLTLGIGTLLLSALTLTLTGPILEAALSRVVSVQSLWIRAWSYLEWVPAAIFMFAAIELLYLLAPNLPAVHRATLPGALVAAAGCLALSSGLGLYLKHFESVNLNTSYQYLGIPVAVVIWLYSSAFVLLLGAEINSTLKARLPDSFSIPQSA